MAKEILDARQLAMIKRDINLQLKPIWELLDHKKAKLKAEDWNEYVAKTRNSVINHSNQYLTVDLKQREVISELINKVFDGYVESQTAL